MKIRFISPANNELDEAVRYYNHQLPGLGVRFFQEIAAAIERIELMPEAWTKIGEQTRRCILKGFPYALLYIIEPKAIIITAVAHLHRDPEHYKDRIK
ncbi:MAG: type II toxin-antitoxin system RelE/ParE family toxin [Pseudomonadota bacterium]